MMVLFSRDGKFRNIRLSLIELIINQGLLSDKDIKEILDIEDK